MREHTRIHTVLIVLAVILGIGVVIEGYFLVKGEKEEHAASKLERPVPPSVVLPPGGPAVPVAVVDPYQEMLKMQKKIDRMFEDMISKRAGQGGLQVDRTLFEPMFDIKETDHEYVIVGDLPGMERDKISIYFEGEHLVIKGVREVEKVITEEKGTYRKERQFGSFQRVVPLPPHTDKAGLKAEYKNGVLTVIVPKTVPAAPAGSHETSVPSAGEGNTL